jgi:hypothetical protein
LIGVVAEHQPDVGRAAIGCDVAVIRVAHGTLVGVRRAGITENPEARWLAGAGQRGGGKPVI